MYPDVMRYITGYPLPIERTARTLEKFISHQVQHGYSVWAVTDQRSGALVGHGGLMTLPNGQDIELDYAFARRYWGKGYATEVARAVLNYAFEVVRLEEVYALTFPENSASKRVIQKLGMTYLARNKQFYNIMMDIYTLKRSVPG
jgi:ribosomal-protein-alanine N-acetyltransferase